MLATLDTVYANVESLDQATAQVVSQHPSHQIITSFPGLSDTTNVRVSVEIGDDCTRFADACDLNAYAGSAPVTHASPSASSSQCRF